MNGKVVDPERQQAEQVAYDKWLREYGMAGWSHELWPTMMRLAFTAGAAFAREQSGPDRMSHVERLLAEAHGGICDI